MTCKVCEYRKKFGDKFETETRLCELLSILKCDGLFKEVVTKETAKWWKEHKRKRNKIVNEALAGFAYVKGPNARS